MDEKKKLLYNYVDQMHKKNEEIHKVLSIKQKNKIKELKKIEESKKMIKNIGVYIDNIDDAQRTSELNYLNLKNEVSIQKFKLENLNTLLEELPLILKKKKEKYDNYKKERFNELDNLMKTSEPSYERSKNIDNKWEDIKACRKKTQLLNNKIKNTNDELAIINKKYINLKYELQDLIQLEKNQNDKLNKIYTILQIIQKLKEGTQNINEEVLKNSLEEIYSLYE
ncbi:conserved protein, unknown function [Hepatocystis sp. ex Piliocolobus tephrosceles]|nr:conserved protein, unknown function [Hepatocystis sp. ex Piliocolobus tephrosceles]